MKRVWLLLSIGMVCIIWGNSILPGSISSEQSSLISVPLTHFLNRLFSTSIEVETISMLVRKLAHFGQFFILGVLLSITIYQYGLSLRKTYVLTNFIGFAVALFDECIQIITPDRGPSFFDVFIDVLGLIVASLLIYYIRSIRQANDIKTIPIL